MNLKKKGNEMKKMFVLAAMGIACAGCIDTRRGQCPEDDIELVVECRFAELGKVIGLNEAIFADTNRFPVAASLKSTAGGCKGSHDNCSVKLPTPVLGCSRAVVFSEEWDSLQLNEVQLERSFEGSGKELQEECLRICREIAGKIGVEFNEDDVENCFGFREWHTVARFVLADDQEITVRARETLYVSRDGGYVAIRPGEINIDFEFNESSCFADFNNSRLKKLKKELGSENTDTSSSKTKKIDIGYDCSKIVAREVKSSKSRKISRERRRRDFEIVRRRLKVFGGPL